MCRETFESIWIYSRVGVAGEKVAKSVRTTPEYVKNVVENMERTAGEFGFRGVRKAIKSGAREISAPARA
jgi:hypothetical protein